MIVSLVGCNAAPDAARPGANAGPGGGGAKAKPEMETIEAEILNVEPEHWPKIIHSQGSLFGDEQTTVGTEVAGMVAEVHVDFGDLVEAGDPLVTLDQAEFRLQAAQAEAQLQQVRSSVGLRDGQIVDSLVPENAPPVREQKALWDEAKNNLQRAQDLQSNNAIARGEYDAAVAAERVAEARYSSAINSVLEKIALIGVREAELSLARQHLEETVIRAPLDGYVQERQVSPGTYLSIGQSIAVLVRTNPLRFRGTIPERQAQALAIGQQVDLTIESVDAPYRATVTRISPMLDQRSRALAFEANVQNDDRLLRAGLFAEADIVIDPEAKAIVVPDSAIIEFAGTQKVWKVVDGMASEQEIVAGARRNPNREILEGLAVGDQILRDASKGRIAKVVPIQVSTVPQERTEDSTDSHATVPPNP